MGPPAVACVVVTRDREVLLRECLLAIGAQTRQPDRLLVVDNVSTDGTPNMVRRDFPKAELLVLTDNVGSAGGFSAGLQAASEGGADWVWLMDDDTIPAPDALARLLDAPWQPAGLPEPDLLASRVNWTDGNPHPMNTSILRRRDADGLLDAAAAGLLPLRATTWVSLLVSRSAIARHGLPVAELFLQGDDIEYTARILREGHGYLVPLSVVEHRTAGAHTFMDGPFRFYYHLRNTLFTLRGRAWSRAEKAALVWVVADSSIRFLLRQRFDREATSAVCRGLRDGLGTSPVP